MPKENFLPALRQGMVNHFSTNELQTLCFDLSLDWDELAGETKSLKVQAIIEHLKNRSRLAELMTVLYRQRPLVSWPDLSPGETWVAGNVVAEEFQKGARHFRLGALETEQTRENTAVTNHTYRWEIEALTSPTSTVILPASNPQPTDFVLQAELKLTTAKPIAYGLFFRNSHNHNCYFLLWGGSQQYKFTTFDRANNSSTDNISWTGMSLIEPDGFNNLKVVARATSMNLFVNGEPADQVTNAPATGGQVGVIAFFSAKMTAVIEMRHFSLLVLD
mgnify:FL=1